MSSTFLRHNYIVDLPVLKRRTWSYRGGRAPILSYPLYAHRLIIAAHSALSAYLSRNPGTLPSTHTRLISILLSLYYFVILLSFFVACVPRDHDLPLLSILSFALHHYELTCVQCMNILARRERTYMSIRARSYILLHLMSTNLYMHTDNANKLTSRLYVIVLHLYNEYVIIN